MLKLGQGIDESTIGAHTLSDESCVDRDQAAQDRAAPPALSLRDPLTEDQLELLSFPGPATLRYSSGAHDFDPLAIILTGRERDRLAIARDNTTDQLTLLEPADGTAEDLLCFMLHGEEYGVPLRDVREIIKLRDLTEVPRVPACIEGIISLRGVIVPVFNLRQRFLMPPNDESGQERLVIVQCDAGRCGFRVDRVTGVYSIPRRGMEPAPPVLDEQTGRYIAGIGRAGDRMIILLDIAAIVSVTAHEVGPA